VITRAEHTAETQVLRRSVRWQLSIAVEYDRCLRTGETAALVVGAALNLAEADRLAGRQARA
jgi:hypothetical protein